MCKEEGSTPEKRSFPDSNFIVQGSTQGSLCEQSPRLAFPPVLNIRFHNKFDRKGLLNYCINRCINYCINCINRWFYSFERKVMPLFLVISGNKKAGRVNGEGRNEKGE